MSCDSVAVRPLIKRVAAQIKKAAGDKQLQFSVDVGETVPDRVRADEIRLQQILGNLLNNAVKFTDQGFITLSVTCSKTPAGSQRVEFAVSDSGAGIDETLLAGVFDPFRQGDASLTREHGGAGLGLAISRRLAERMGGTLTAKSTKGKGSVFRLILPCQPNQGARIDNEQIRLLWKGRSVCIWDDDPADMRAAEHLLENFGIRMHYADSVKRIRAQLEEDTPPDAVFLNLDMAGLRDELPALRSVHPDVPWVGLSNWCFDPDEADGKLFTAYLDRPLKKEQVERVLLELRTRLRPRRGERT